MSLPSRAESALRLLPAQLAYHVELSPAEVLERLRDDPDVQVVAGFPAPSRSDRRFLAQLRAHGFRVSQNLAAAPPVRLGPASPEPTRSDRSSLAEPGAHGFRVSQNFAAGTVDTGPAVMRRLALEAHLSPTPRGTLVRARFARGPLSRQASFYIMWVASFAWLGLTGVTGAKLGLVAGFLALTVPAFIYDLVRARGSDGDRIELLNLMSRLLGPAVLGDNPEENMPYRHGRRLPEADADDDDDASYRHGRRLPEADDAETT